MLLILEMLERKHIAQRLSSERNVQRRMIVVAKQGFKQLPLLPLCTVVYIHFESLDTKVCACPEL